MLGFPIRTSADQSPIDGSPQLFAVIHVLHRFLAPRHPPLALISLKFTKMLVLALQLSKGIASALADQFERKPDSVVRTRREQRGQSPCCSERDNSLKTEEKTKTAKLRRQEVNLRLQYQLD